MYSSELRYVTLTQSVQNKVVGPQIVSQDGNLRMAILWESSEQIQLNRKLSCRTYQVINML